MSINQHNYEAYFLDYHEGRLSSEEKHELMAFLAQNPALQGEFEEFAGEALAPDKKVVFAPKEMLKKNMMTFTPAEEKLIALLEGDLSHDEEEEMHRKISLHKESKELYEQYQATLLIPDLDISYPSGSSLKKKTPSVLFLRSRRVMAAAAAIIILIGLSAILLLMPSAETEHASYTLASMERIQVKNIQAGQAFLKLQSREIPEVIKEAAERDYPALSKIPGILSPPMIELPAYYNTNYTLSTRVVQPVYNYAYEMESLAQAESQGNKTLAGKLINGFFNKISPTLGNEKKKGRDKSGSFTFWDIAEFGVKSVNALGDHDYTLLKEYNEEGNVKGVRILEE